MSEINDLLVLYTSGMLKDEFVSKYMSYSVTLHLKSNIYKRKGYIVFFLTPPLILKKAYTILYLISV